MSRGYLYDFFKEYYEMSPHSWDMESVISLNQNDYKTTGVGTYVPGMAYNDIMTHFIELGFGDSSTGCGAIPGIKFPLKKNSVPGHPDSCF